MKHRFKSIFLTALLLAVLLAVSFFIYAAVNQQNQAVLVSRVLELSRAELRASNHYQFWQKEYMRQKKSTLLEIGARVVVEEDDNGQRFLRYQRTCAHSNPLWVHEEEKEAWVLCEACEEGGGENLLWYLDKKNAMAAMIKEIHAEHAAYLEKYFTRSGSQDKEVWQAKSLWEIWLEK